MPAVIREKIMLIHAYTQEKNQEKQKSAKKRKEKRKYIQPQDMGGGYALLVCKLYLLTWNQNCYFNVFTQKTLS